NALCKNPGPPLCEAKYCRVFRFDGKLIHYAASHGVGTRSQKWGSFVIGRKTIKKRMRAKLKAIKVELRKCMHDPIVKTGAWVKQMLQGHLNYYAVSGNHPSLWWFCNQVRWLWLKSLRRRSQKARLSWERYIRIVDRFFPPIKVLHPLPVHRFDAKTRGRSPVR